MDRMKHCKEILICSNPCLELWFLLHEREQRCSLDSDTCLETLKKCSPLWKSYSKGFLTDKQQDRLWEMRNEARARAETLLDDKSS